MRLQGRLTQWNDDRGFGFVTQNGTGKRHFLHISELTSRRARPAVGDLLTFEAGTDGQGRVQARNARHLADGPERTASRGIGALVMTVLVICAFAYVVSVRISSPNSTIAATAYKIVFARDALRSHPEFECRPEKNSCAKMTSCAEALFHQERCAVAGMDGDHDGIPCEQQWCN